MPEPVVVSIWLVHHKDGNPKNNCIDNLQVMETGEHIKLHHCTSFEPDALERVLVQCPECGRNRFIRYDCTKRPSFTGLCKSCAARLHGKIRQQEGGTPCQSQ